MAADDPALPLEETRTGLADNTTVAATQVALSRVRIIDADGTDLIALRRSGLTPAQKQYPALYDNRTKDRLSYAT